jgi:hypothetical protein
VVSCWPHTSEVRVRSQTSLCGICGGQSSTGRGFSFQVLWYFPVSILPPVLHTHILFVCHRRYINLTINSVDIYEYNISPLCLQSCIVGRVCCTATLGERTHSEFLQRLALAVGLHCCVKIITMYVQYKAK